MPTQFRFFESFRPKVATNGNHPHAQETQEQTRAAAVPPDPSETILPEPTTLAVDEIEPEVDQFVASESDQDGRTSGLHGILKKTDVGFSWQLSRLEDYALTQARLHAQASLPRQDSPAQELDAEKVLIARAAELFSDWVARVRRKIEDRIQELTLEAGSVLAQLRDESIMLAASLAALKKREEELKLAAAELKEKDEKRAEDIRRDEAERRHRTAEEQKRAQIAVGSANVEPPARLLKMYQYIGLVGLLVAIDWIANVAVFAQMLPRNQALDRQWQIILQQASSSGPQAGLKILWSHLLFDPDASGLAFGVVIFLMFLGHVVGSGLRRARGEHQREGNQTAYSFWKNRGLWLPTAGFLGIVLVLVFLFSARSNLKNTSAERLASAEQVLQQYRSDKASADDASRKIDIDGDIEEQQVVLKHLHEDDDYAKQLSGINLPICLLNIVLALVACIAGYLHAKPKAPLSLGSAEPECERPADPALEAPRPRPSETELMIAKEAILARSHRILSLEMNAESRISSARYLARSHPLRDWPAKKQRLESVIALFRAENARNRGIDVQNIRPFEIKPVIDLSIPDDVEFAVPDELFRYEEELQQARTDLAPLRADLPVLPFNGVIA